MNTSAIAATIWAYATRTLTEPPGTPDDAVTFLEQIVAAIWTHAERTLTGETAAKVFWHDPFIQKQRHTVMTIGLRT